MELDWCIKHLSHDEGYVLKGDGWYVCMSVSVERGWMLMDEETGDSSAL
jgi:hypothetical protein